MSKAIAKKILRYTAIYEPDSEGGYVVSIPAIPGCVTYGKTFEKATSMIEDALKGCVAVLKKEGIEIPRERGDIVVTKISIDEPLHNQL